MRVRRDAPGVPDGVLDERDAKAGAVIYVSLASLGAVWFVILCATAALRSMQRQHAREREALLARLMHLAGRTWELPPSQEHFIPPEPEFDEARYSMAPEQLPE
jgi:hypothetical protein